MAGQAKFGQFLTIFSNYRTSFLNRSLTFNFIPAATLRQESKEKLMLLPEKPKKPMTPFFLFAQMRRVELKKVHPNAKVTELAKLLSEEWNKADASVKHEYETKYKKAMDSYLKKYLEYNSCLTEDQKNTIKEISVEKKKDKSKRALQKTLKEVKKPKRPKGPYIYFVMEYYNKDKAKYSSFAEFLIKSKAIWENLSDDEKQRFRDMHLDDKKRYELEMEEWEAKMVSEGRTELVRQTTLHISNIPVRPIKPNESDKSVKVKTSKASSKKPQTSIDLDPTSNNK